MAKQTGNEAVDEMAKEPSVDMFFDRNPRTLTDDELRQLIAVERVKRATFIEKKASK